MSQEWKSVPVVPTAVMVSEGDRRFSFDVDKIYAAMLAAAPLPPSGGEPEVVGYLCNAGTVLMMADQKNAAIWNAGHPLIELQDHRSHVTRLQAEIKHLLHTSVKEEVFDVVCKERDALKAEVERMTALLHDRSVHIGALDSELTKAWELLRAIYESGSYKGEIVFRVRDLLAHQSAPAMKGEGDE